MNPGFLKYIFSFALAAIAAAMQANVTINVADYGVRPGTGKDMSARMAKALGQIAEKYKGEEVTRSFAPGRYDFWPEKAAEKNYFISNHDQTSKRVGICFTAESYRKRVDFVAESYGKRVDFVDEPYGKRVNFFYGAIING